MNTPESRNPESRNPDLGNTDPGSPAFSAWEVSDPELENAVDLSPRKRGSKLLIGVVAGAIAVGLIAMMVGVVPLFQRDDSTPNALAELDLPTAAVPAGGFGEQQPKWVDCGDGFSCAEVQAPLDWGADLESVNDVETISLRMVKHPATSGAPLGTLFVNPGGPGASGADYVREGLDYAVGASLRENYDVIGWDPRGVGASSPVSCFTDAEMDEYLFGLDEEVAGLERGSDEWISAATEESREFGSACAKNSGAVLGFVDTMSTVHDLDMLREIVGDEQLNYLGYSYGTYIGARYADTFPGNVGRVVLDGAVNPSASLADVVREQTVGFELALRAFVTSCLGDNDCPLPGGEASGGFRTVSTGTNAEAVDAAMAYIGELLDRVDADPLTGSDGRSFSSSTFLTAIVTPLYSEFNWGYLKQLFASVEAGNADIGLALADSYYGRLNGVYLDNSTEAFSAINCLDYPSDVNPERMREEAKELEQLAPTIGRFQGYGGLSCSGWPYAGVNDRGPVVGAGAAPIVVIGTTGDPATPYESAVILADQLESGVLLSYEGEGHTAYGNDACVNEAVETYFLDGVPPAEGTFCR